MADTEKKDRMGGVYNKTGKGKMADTDKRGPDGGSEHTITGKGKMADTDKKGPHGGLQ